MNDPITEAVLAAAERPGEAPPRVYEVGPEAEVTFGAGRNPLDGMTVGAHWTRD